MKTKLAIPVWLLTLIGALLFFLGWLLSRQNNPRPLPDTPIIAADPKQLPENAVVCGEVGNYTCAGLDDSKLTLLNVPDGVTPYLLPISSDEETVLYDLPKDNIGCIASISGNLVFYDENNALYTSFPAPVTIEIQYGTDTEEFFTIFNTGAESLKELNSSQKAIDCATELKSQGVEEIDIVPVYLYTPLIDGYSDFHIWKPFTNFTVDPESRMMTVEILYWGDMQFGGGTKP